MKTLLALDVATTTGFAFGPVDARPISGAIRFGTKGASDPEVWSKALVWLNEQLSVLKPDVVALEAPIHTASTAGGSSAAAFVRLNGLQAVLRTVVELRLPQSARLVNVQSARKFLIGHGNKPGEEAKRLVKARCVELGWLDGDEPGFDRSDALCVWAKAAGDISPAFAANFTLLGTTAKPAAERAMEF